MTIEAHVPLAPMTTFGLGGAARALVRVGSVEALREATRYAHEQGLKVLVLGGGSNVLIADEGFDGLVMKIELRGISITDVDDSKKVLIAAAGESWDAIVAHAVDAHLWGVENLSGIPGTVGGAVDGNIGAYGQAVSQTCQWVDAYDREQEVVRRFDGTACAFGYRDSMFKQAAGRYVIVQAAFALSAAAAPDLSYQDLAQRFANDSAPTLAAIRAAVLAIRAGKFPDLTVEGTAGSFFKNPILSATAAAVLRERFPEMPVFAMPETSGVKIPLAWLLDHVLHLKGCRVGSARLFEKQPLVVAVDRGGSARDCIALSTIVTERVQQTFSITLQPEVQIIA